MSFLSKMKDFLGGGVDAEDYDYEYEEEVYQGQERSQDRGLDRNYYEYEDEPEPPPRKEKRKSSNVLEFQTGRGQGLAAIANPATKIVIVRPEDLEDATWVCDHLRDNEICIVNMQGIDVQAAQRLADYMAGVSYALYAKIERIETNIVVIAPEAIPITPDLKAKIKSVGSFKTYTKS